MKKVLALSSVLLGVVFLAGCGQQPASQIQQPTNPSPAAQQPATNQPSAIQSSPANIQESNVATVIPVDWKTYSNNEFDIEFKYPEKMMPKEDKQKSQVLKGVTLFSVSLLPTDQKKYSTSDGNQGTYIMDAYRKEDKNPNIAEYQNAIKNSENIIAGNSGLKWYCKNGQSLNNLEFRNCTVLNKKGNLDQLDFTFKDSELLQKSDFDNIVKSFKFTK